MKFRALLCLGFFVSALSPALADPSPTVADFSPLNGYPVNPNLAPADREFGQLHMTVLGIANEIRWAGNRFTDSSSAQELTGGSVAYTIDALRDWERSFPADPWIARNLLGLTRVYLRLHNDVAHDAAVKCVAWLSQDFPDRAETVAARNELLLATGMMPAEVPTVLAPIEEPPPALPSYATPL